MPSFFKRLFKYWANSDFPGETLPLITKHPSFHSFEERKDVSRDVESIKKECGPLISSLEEELNLIFSSLNDLTEQSFFRRNDLVGLKVQCDEAITEAEFTSIQNQIDDIHKIQANAKDQLQKHPFFRLYLDFSTKIKENGLSSYIYASSPFLSNLRTVVFDTQGHPDIPARIRLESLLNDLEKQMQRTGFGRAFPKKVKDEPDSPKKFRY